MRGISPKVKKGILALEQNEKCARHEECSCEGRLTWEHAWIYAGRQIDEVWAIIAICAKHHDLPEYQGKGDMNKELNQYHSLKRAELIYGPNFLEVIKEKYPKKNWDQEWSYLSGKFN